MLQFILLFYIGRTFYRLSDYHAKGTKWLYALLGVAICFIGQVLGAVIVGVIFYPDELMTDSFTSSEELILDLIGLPFGVLLT